MRTAARLALLLALVVAPIVGCDGGGASVVPTLGDVVGRVDVPRLLECASMRGADRAKCLGASVLTTALDLAVDKAADLAERARDAVNAGAGADDMTDEQRQDLARQLDAALDDVGREVAKAQPTG